MKSKCDDCQQEKNGVKERFGFSIQKTKFKPGEQSRRPANLCSKCFQSAMGKVKDGK